MWFSKKFIGLLVLDGVLIFVAVTLSILQNLWQIAIAVTITLFVVNTFLLPMALRPPRPPAGKPVKGLRTLLILGCAMLASALYHLMIMAAGKFTLPGVIGSVSALIVGAFFIFVVIKGKRVFK